MTNPTEAVPTPRTDTAWDNEWRTATESVNASPAHGMYDHACVLERELIAAQATNAELVANVNLLGQSETLYRDKLRACRTQLQKAERERDAARNKALEEAAQICALEVFPYDDGDQVVRVMNTCTRLIRTLISPTKPADETQEKQWKMAGEPTPSRQISLEDEVKNASYRLADEVETQTLAEELEEAYQKGWDAHAKAHS